MENQKSNIILPGNLIQETERILKNPEQRIFELENKVKELEFVIINLCTLIPEALWVWIEENTKHNYDYKSKYEMISNLGIINIVDIFKDNAPEEIKILPEHVKRMAYMNVIMQTILSFVKRNDIKINETK